MSYDVTIVIPTFNAEKYIADTLASVKNQTFNGNLEILVIDDCSTDNTIELIEEFGALNDGLYMRLLRQEKNMKQGTARNRGIREAQGNYIFFLDADDFIDSNTIEAMVKKADSENCDFVICDWSYYYEDEGMVYVNNEDFLFNNMLFGKDIEALLKANTYFTVNKLYRKSFLESNNISYGEGYIYEDFEFYIQVAQHGKVVGIVHNPFYKVRVNEFSTTKTNSKGSLHVDSLLQAIQNTLNKFSPRDEYSFYHVYKYLIRKTLQYLDQRAPRKYKRMALRKVLTLLNQRKIDYTVPRKVVPLYHFLFRRRYVQNSSTSKILFIWYLYSKRMLNPIFSKVLKVKWFIFDSKIGKNIRRRKRKKRIDNYYKQPIKKERILFLGFDYRYTGNSKYLFDFMKNYSDLEVLFVTKDTNVPKANRVTPRSLRFYKYLAQSNIVIFESWVPLAFNKREGTTWIQLWHGTPFKKLFFDSHEYYISSYNRNHKKNKQRDIRRWDYLLSDSVGGSEKLSSAFAYDKEKILDYGYPRVQWLIDNKDNIHLKREIKEMLSIPNEKKVILYAPTWRDYNYKSKNPDLEYLANVDLLQQKLSDDYVILYKEHSMGIKHNNNKNIIIPDEEIETQKLILASDILISDYSSIIFDGMAINVPFYLYINDLNMYQKARGVYEDMESLLSAFSVDNESELISKIKDMEEEYPKEQYEVVKNLFANNSKLNSNQILKDKIMSIVTTSSN
ncbi:hypothetical protein OBCHQ24_16320 [Oceanobacillus iheyensis]|nr:hypothetical protein OBCHQ24_16320 [Oceanobacillus iheyensis]